MPLAGSGDSSQSVVSLAVETPMSIRTPAHLYGDCASPSAAYYGESCIFGQDCLVGSSSPFGLPTTSTPSPVVFEGEEQPFCGAPQSFSTFANPPTSAPQQPFVAVVPQVAGWLPAVVEMPGAGQQQQQPGILSGPGAWPFAAVPTCGAGNIAPAASSQHQQFQEFLGDLREKNRAFARQPELPGAAVECLLAPPEMMQPAAPAAAAGQQEEQFQQPLQNQQQQQQQQPSFLQQQQQMQHEQQTVQNIKNANAGQSSVLAELRQEAADSVFLQHLLEAASLVKEEERLTQQLDERRQYGAGKQRKPDPAVRARVEQARTTARKRQEELGWRLRGLAEQGAQELQEEALRALLPRCWRTATDALGRHVLERFFELGSWESKRRLVREGLSGGVLRLSLHQHGCHVIQAALAAVPLEDAQEGLVVELRGRVWELIESPHGNHVIQKVLITLPAPCVGFVVQECLPRAEILAKHPYGCRVLQRLLETYPVTSEPMQALLEVLFRHFCELVTDSFGNYVLQHVLEYGSTQDRQRVIEKLQPVVGQCATHRCASNLVEKALRVEEELVASSADQALEYRLALAILGEQDEAAPVVAMAQDKYGNHIVQRMLGTQSPAPVRQVIAARLRSQRQQLQQGTGARYAKHVLAALDTLPA